MNLVTTSSPHIRGNERTDKIMKDVLIALLPTLAAGVYFFGVRALLVALVSVISAMAGEFIWGVFTKKQGTVMDASAAVTGLLLALTLPASVPYWVPVVGSLFAVIVAKGICGGLGQNTFNPALAGRALLILVCPVYLTRYLAAGTKLSVSVPVDAVAGSTPLHDMVMGTLPEASVMDMFIGNIGGCIGEVSALALLIGGAYLVIKKVISPRIPVAYLGTIAVLSLIFSKGDSPMEWMLYSVLGGGAMLGGIFMLTDYSSSPVTAKGQILYAVCAGALTVLFRVTGIFPEGVTYAILLMNAFAWVIDEKMRPRRFGAQKGGAQ